MSKLTGVTIAAPYKRFGVAFVLIIGSSYLNETGIYAQGCDPNYTCESGSGQEKDYCAYPDTGCPTNMTGVGSCCCVATPLLIDVSGNGLALSNSANGVYFDIGRDGKLDRVAWTLPNSDDAWVVLDRNDNGVIDDGTELFGNVTPQPQPDPGTRKNGFLALAVYDKAAEGGNEDSTIDSRDAVFARLRLWQDRNHDGLSQPSELSRLPSLGVAGLDLKYKESRRQDEYGNQFRYRAKTLRSDGSDAARWAWDVILTIRAIQP